MATRITDIEQQLWQAADELRANSNLSSQEYSLPVLGLIFLRYADHRFSQAEAQIQAELAGMSVRRRAAVNVPQLCQARGIMYVPEEARFQQLVALPEVANVSQAVSDAMKAIEAHNPPLKDILPKTYNRLNNATLATLLKHFNSVPMDIAEDAFGRIYEYFLGQFAMGEGRRGGEFFTPSSVVRLIVEVIEPYRGRILDPACGSGGMFVQSARFVAEHQNGNGGDLSIHGQERVNQTVRLCKMNLAVHGLEGDIRQANSYYENPHNLVGKFDFVMANPPFNVNNVDRERLKGDTRFPLGLPRVDNANYLWIQQFYSALNETGRAGFVMANSASDARHSEQEIRQRLIESGAVDIMIAISSNFFYTVTLPCTLWFFDKGKPAAQPSADGDQLPLRSQDTVLFIDARRIFRQVTRAVRDFTEEQLQFIADIARLYRGEAIDVEGREIPVDEGWGGATMMAELYPESQYNDVPGLCKVATRADIEAQGWSLNPGRYVGVADRTEDEIDFFERLQELNEELELLNLEARQLEEQISENVFELMESEI